MSDIESDSIEIMAKKIHLTESKFPVKRQRRGLFCSGSEDASSENESNKES